MRHIELDIKIKKLASNITSSNYMKINWELEKFIKLYPSYKKMYVVYNELGNIADKFCNDYEKAKYYYNLAVNLKEDYADLYNNLAILHAKNNNITEAENCFAKGIEIEPNHKYLLENYTTFLQLADRNVEAITYLKRLVEIDNHNIEAMHAICSICFHKNLIDEGRKWCEKIIDIKPGFAPAYVLLGRMELQIGLVEEAFLHLNEALKLCKDDLRIFDIYNDLGNLYTKKHETQKAIECYKKALEYPSSEKMPIFSNYLFALNYSENISQEQVFEEHKKFGDLFCSEANYNFSNNKEINRKLRIGYVSPDFRTHSVVYFIYVALAAHDKNRFEVCCYSDVKNSDITTEQIKTVCDRWVDISKFSDDEATKLIKEDNIDILIDLSGHTGNNRMGVFAKKAAPVQVTWIGYPNTTGLKTMDYRITDGFADPFENDKYYTEKLVRMSNCFLCYSPQENSPEVLELPYMKNGYITFGSFNNFSKISDDVIDAWCKILLRVASSKLFMKAGILEDEKTREKLFEQFETKGIVRERIILSPWTESSFEHLNLYNRVDIALDTFPFNGATTTCEAIYMGVPVVTLVGLKHASRVGLTLLKNVGLEECISYSVEEYIDKAVKLVSNIDELKQKKNNLRQQMNKSSLKNADEHIKELEGLYLKMWEYYCKKSDTENILDKSQIIKIQSLLNCIKMKFEINEKQLDRQMSINNLMEIINDFTEISGIIKEIKDENIVALMYSINKGFTLLLNCIESNDGEMIENIINKVLRPAFGNFLILIETMNFDNVNS